MSIDLNKKYALTGSQLTKLKTYIDNSGGGGGSEILYGADEPKDSQGEDGQLYVVIPELEDDDYATIRLTYSHPNGYVWERQEVNSLSTAYDTGYSLVEQYIQETGEWVEYPRYIYGPYATIYALTSWESGGEIYTNLNDAVTGLNYKASEYGGSVTLSGTTITYTYNGSSTQYTSWQTCANQVHSDYENAQGWADWEVQYAENAYYINDGMGMGIEFLYSVSDCLERMFINCNGYDSQGNTFPIVRGEYTDNKIIVKHPVYDESVTQDTVETLNFNDAISRFNSLLPSNEYDYYQTIDFVKIKAERL